MTNITLIGRPITKKNHQQMVVAGNGRKFLIQSKAYRQYEKDCLKQLMYLYKGKTITGQLSMKALYYMPTKARPDLLNLLQASADILEKAKVIENDKNIYSFDNSRIMGIDKLNPRVEIEIEEVNDNVWINK